MKTFEVQQKATIWYTTKVEAENAEEAIKKVSEGEGDDWRQVLDTTEFQDEFWTQETGLVNL